jgi:hypothetical protein
VSTLHFVMSRTDAHKRRLRRLGRALASWCLVIAVGGSAAEARLVFKRADGSVIRFTGTPRAWCGPWERDVPRLSVHVALGRGLHHWELSAVRRDFQIGRRIRFPNDFVWNRPRRALLFVADGANEASTAEEESSGSMEFSRVSCRRGGLVAFSIRAVLGSEFSGGEPVRVSGTYSGRVSAQR